MQFQNIFRGISTFIAGELARLFSFNNIYLQQLFKTIEEYPTFTQTFLIVTFHSNFKKRNHGFI